MSILIRLSVDDVRQLIRHLPVASDLSRKLDASERINCNPRQAQELLNLANEHCSAAVPKIKSAMITAGVKF